MKKKLILFFLIFTLLIISFFYSINKLLSDDIESIKVNIKGDVYTLLIADSVEEQSKGLSGLESLDEDKGMIFIFNTPDFYGFWMKDTLIHLDMIWLDENKKVVYIKYNAQPESYFETPPAVYTPTTKALYVVELNAGQSERVGLNVGDTIEF